MIAVIEKETELAKFTSLLKEECENYLKENGPPLDLRNDAVYEYLMNCVKIKYRAWQMSQPGYGKSIAGLEYKMEASRKRL